MGDDRDPRTYSPYDPVVLRCLDGKLLVPDSVVVALGGNYVPVSKRGLRKLVDLFIGDTIDLPMTAEVAWALSRNMRALNSLRPEITCVFPSGKVPIGIDYTKAKMRHLVHDHETTTIDGFVVACKPIAIEVTVTCETVG